MKIASVSLKIVSDSRGENTLEAEMSANGISVKDSVPHGKSRGRHEAFVMEPETALLKFGAVKDEITARNFVSQKEFDDYLIALAGPAQKMNLGGNLTLVLSLAWARLAAQISGQGLFEYVRGIYGQQPTANRFPSPLFNVIEGGVHAKNRLSFQEFLVRPHTNEFSEAFELGREFYRELGLFLKSKYGDVPLGDETGFAPAVKFVKEALEILANLIQKNNYPLCIGLDAAATQLYHRTNLRGQNVDLRSPGANPREIVGFYFIDGRKYSADELFEFYLELLRDYPIIFIEDPFTEEDFEYFAKLTQCLKRDLAQGRRENSAQSNLSTSQSNLSTSDVDRLIVADDLTVTNPQRLKIAISKNAGNALIIKPNQIGTLSETLEVCKIADSAGWKKIVSHRSGETNDDFIADLAVGVGAWGIKAGAPARIERLSKYERLLEIFNP